MVTLLTYHNELPSNSRGFPMIPPGAHWPCLFVLPTHPACAGPSRLFQSQTRIFLSKSMASPSALTNGSNSLDIGYRLLALIHSQTSSITHFESANNMKDRVDLRSLDICGFVWSNNPGCQPPCKPGRKLKQLALQRHCRWLPHLLQLAVWPYVAPPVYALAVRWISSLILSTSLNY